MGTKRHSQWVHELSDLQVNGVVNCVIFDSHAHTLRAGFSMADTSCLYTEKLIPNTQSWLSPIRVP
jgi:hypothetical protein